MFVELYNRPKYFQIWDRDGQVYTYEGNIGEQGVRAEASALPEEAVTQTINRLRSEAHRRGFVALPSDQLTQVVVSISIEGWDADEVDSLHEAMRTLLGSALGWTGNGFYDGYALGKERFESWCLVIDVAKGIQALSAALEHHGFLRDTEFQTIISVDSEDGYRVVFPQEPNDS